MPYLHYQIKHFKKLRTSKINQSLYNISFVAKSRIVLLRKQTDQILVRSQNETILFTFLWLLILDSTLDYLHSLHSLEALQKRIEPFSWITS